MDSDVSVPQSEPQQTVVKKQSHPNHILGCVLLALLCGFLGYWLGFKNGQKHEPLQQMPKEARIKPVPTSTKPNKKSSKSYPLPYTLSYTIPQGFTTLLWHPTPDSTASAIISPDYLPFKSPAGIPDTDPDPQSGMAIFILKKPNPIYTVDQLKASTENTEEGMQQITQTSIGGFPAYRAQFLDSDSNRTLDDYHVLVGTDEWVIRIVFPGLSMVMLQKEEQNYSIQLSDFLQSIQFLQYYK